MKDIVINGMPKRVFPLRETDNALVYISIDKLLRVDYHRLKNLEQNSREEDLLKSMRDTTLDNGSNALVLYSPLIEVLFKTPPRSLFKDRTTANSPETIQREVEEAADGEEYSHDYESSDEDVEPKRKSSKRGPGRPPKNSS